MTRGLAWGVKKSESHRKWKFKMERIIGIKLVEVKHVCVFRDRSEYSRQVKRNSKCKCPEVGQNSIYHRNSRKVRINGLGEQGVGGVELAMSSPIPFTTQNLLSWPL